MSSYCACDVEDDELLLTDSVLAELEDLDVVEQAGKDGKTVKLVPLVAVKDAVLDAEAADTEAIQQLQDFRRAVREALNLPWDARDDQILWTIRALQDYWDQQPYA